MEENWRFNLLIYAEQLGKSANIIIFTLSCRHPSGFLYRFAQYFRNVGKQNCEMTAVQRSGALEVLTFTGRFISIVTIAPAAIKLSACMRSVRSSIRSIVLRVFHHFQRNVCLVCLVNHSKHPNHSESPPLVHVKLFCTCECNIFFKTAVFREPRFLFAICTISRFMETRLLLHLSHFYYLKSAFCFLMILLFI